LTGDYENRYETKLHKYKKIKRIIKLTSIDFFSKVDLTPVNSKEFFKAKYSIEIIIRNLNIVCGATYKDNHNKYFTII